MNAEQAASLMISIAKEDVGKTEITHNRAPWIRKLWPATDYPEGHDNREPYCAAGMAWVLQQFILKLRDMGELQKTLGKTFKEAERWRCKSARAFGWRDWAKRAGVKMLDESSPSKPGDFVVFDFSHIGLSLGQINRNTIRTIEYNCTDKITNEGDGCFQKVRPCSLVQCYIRILPW